MRLSKGMRFARYTDCEEEEFCQLKGKSARCAECEEVCLAYPSKRWFTPVEEVVYACRRGRCLPGVCLSKREIVSLMYSS